MKNIHVLIVDDEEAARRKIKSYLKDEKGVAKITEARTGVEAVQLIKKKRPDLIFLDIQMPGMTGFGVIESIGAENMPAVVFVTAYDQYAIDAFEVQAVDYLLKPYDRARFKKSLFRAIDSIASGISYSRKIESLLEKIRKEERCLNRILVKKGPRYFLINTDTIMYISAYEKYIKLHTPDEVFLVRNTLHHMEERLNSSKFVRIHRSSIVNMDYIREVQPWSHGDCIVILKDGEQLSLSRRYRDRLFEKFTSAT